MASYESGSARILMITADLDRDLQYLMRFEKDDRTHMILHSYLPVYAVSGMRVYEDEEIEKR